MRITKNDPRFATLEHGFNLRWPSPGKGPSVIHVCRSEQEIRDALEDSLHHVANMPGGPGPRPSVTVRSGGHCYEAFVSDNHGGAIIDVSQYGGLITVDDPDQFFPDLEELRVDSEAARRVLAELRTENPEIAANLPEVEVPESREELERELTSAGGAIGFKILPGTMNWDGYVSLYKRFGKTIPGGSCYSVAAGGHISGGGYGLLSRAHGLTTDWLTAVDVLLTFDGKRSTKVHAVRNGLNAELFMLCAGAGGGNVGIITAFYFADLPPAPSKATLVFKTISWSRYMGTGGRQRFVEFLQRYGDFFASGPGSMPEFDGLFALLHVKPASTGTITLTLQACELDGCVPPDAALQTFLDDVIKDDAVAVTTSTGVVQVGHAYVSVPGPSSTSAVEGAVDLDWLTATQYLNGSGHNQRGKYKSAYLIDTSTSFAEGLYDALSGELPQGTAKELDEHARSSAIDVSQCLVQIDSYGGQINRSDSRGLAVYQRASNLKVQYQAYWSDAAEDDAFVDWLRGVYTATFRDGLDGTPYPYTQLRGQQPSPHYQGCYINYPDVDMLDAFGGATVEGVDAWMVLYYGRTLPHSMIYAKRGWDPTNTFRNTMSVPMDFR